MDDRILRKAVELADGWSWYEKTKQISLEFGPSQYDFICTDTHDPEQYLLDALAAQLTRQVDALCPHYNIVHSKWRGGKQDPHTVLIGLRSPVMSFTENLAEVEGPDRTANTIEVIVNSRVLER